MSGFITRRGGGSNLKIIQATSLPSKGKDGQLIIISSIPINNITYNTTTTKPSNPVNGDLFICFGISDYHKVLQYTTTNSWNSVDSYVWINSSWI
ncbi:MAG: hypothetical protein E7270_01175 [Lachnospiraceae bacterium]|nr:hypothetical protein [Lachnospiraceae bacterium]